MSYNQGYPPYGGPPPQQGYGQPPPGQYPPQQGYGGAPPQQYGGYNQPPQGQHPPQGQYPPQGQHGGQPPGQYGQQPPYGAPPQGQYPQGQYNAPPQGQYGGQAPSHSPYPPQQQGGYPPNQQSYGAPAAPYGAPPQQYGAPPVQPTPPTPGYVPGQMVQVDLSRTADALRNAMKGFGTNEAVLIQHLAHLPALEVPVLKQQYQQRHNRSLEKDVEKEVSGYFEMALLSILRGPLQQDVWCLNKSLKGAGTKEDLLDDVLVGRSNADMHAIKQAYQHTYGRSLENDVQNDLSMKTARLFSMITAGTRMEDSAPVIPQQVDADITELHRATEAKTGTEELTVCAILSNRNDAQIRAISHGYQQKYRIDLEKVLKNEFRGHMEEVLIQMVRKACDKAMRDAMEIEETMKGPGTKDELLVCRLTAVHWDRAHMHQVRGAYRKKYGKELISRIKSETSGDYEKCLVAMCE